MKNDNNLCLNAIKEVIIMSTLLMNRVGQLPCELQNHIYEYSSNHKVLFKPVLHCAVKKAIEKRIQNLHERYIKAPPNTLRSFIDQIEEDIHDRQLFIDHLNSCNCCSRHKRNKPSQVGEIWTTFNQHPEDAHLEEGEIPCRCDCRHLARQFATLFETHYY